MKIASALLLSSLLLAACASSSAPPLVPTGSELREIAVLEDGRSIGGHRLEELLEHADPLVRQRAATALGRMPWPEQGAEVTRALMVALHDEESDVRAAAAFALGMRGDPLAGDRLLFLALDEHEADGDAEVRARAIEAVSKLDRADLRLRTLDALRDPDAAVRIEAAEGAHRWSRDEDSAAAVDQRLMDHTGHDTEGEVIWMTIFALQRRAAPRAKPIFQHFAASNQGLERLFAVRGLKALAPDPDVLGDLERASGDRDWRIACEAVVGLGAYGLETSPQALFAATHHANPHVRRSAWESLSARLSPERAGATSEIWPPIFARTDPLEDVSPAVRAAFLAARARFGSHTGSAPLNVAELMESLRDVRGTPLDSIVLARSLANEDDPGAVELLELLARSPDPRIAGPAIEALGGHPSPEVRTRLQGLLSSEDNGLRLAAVLALREMADESDLDPLMRAFRTSRGEIGPEVRFNSLRNAGAIGGKRASVVLMQGLTDPDAYVRRIAREELERGWPDVNLPAEAALAEPEPRPDPVPVAGADYPAYRRNPRVEIETTRGVMVFELFPGEAPLHVHSFLELAERGHYDGTLFHRVVPDFVIQGGDRRGDGNGGTTFRGSGSLRHEITPRKYVRGSLGMPRNENPESGGSQIFVTHRPTPHLDGRYTIFGELRRGARVLDTIEVRDRIVGVRQLR
jgi:cyclophilin family peptidyl-prolyl cis-trans isomerase/HEAT repeat protein